MTTLQLPSLVARIKHLERSNASLRGHVKRLKRELGTWTGTQEERDRVKRS